MTNKYKRHKTYNTHKALKLAYDIYTTKTTCMHIKCNINTLPTFGVYLIIRLLLLMLQLEFVCMRPSVRRVNFTILVVLVVLVALVVLVGYY
jgi:hypothetical protein